MHRSRAVRMRRVSLGLAKGPAKRQRGGSASAASRGTRASCRTRSRRLYDFSIERSGLVGSKVLPRLQQTDWKHGVRRRLMMHEEFGPDQCSGGWREFSRGTERCEGCRDQIVRVSEMALSFVHRSRCGWAKGLLTVTSSSSSCIVNATLSKRIGALSISHVTLLTSTASSYEPNPSSATLQASNMISGTENRQSTFGQIAKSPVTVGVEMIRSLRNKVVAIPLAVTPVGAAVAKLVVAQQGGLALGAPSAAQVKTLELGDRRTSRRPLATSGFGSAEVRGGVLQDYNRAVWPDRCDRA